MFELVFTETAIKKIQTLNAELSLKKRYKAFCKTLAYLENNPRHPSLNTHKYSAIKGPHNAEVFEAYAENNTPAAYRIFWCYGPDKKQLTILDITPHP